MYSYTYDEYTGGIVLNSSPTIFSKEPRPVYAYELNMFGFDAYWEYDNQNDIPYMWAEANQYIYRGKIVARLKGGNINQKPEIILATDENDNVIYPEQQGHKLKPIDIDTMISMNHKLLQIIETSTVKKIVSVYEKYRENLDIFHVAFSGGKYSAVLLDLVKKSLPKKSFVVIFGDTCMECPDTYAAVEKTKRICERDEVRFYVSKSHFKPDESWKIFGPPARVLRWCCSVHKSTPQTLKLREITGKNDYIGMDFVGVRKHESVARSEYEYENLSKKQKGQYSFNAILDWTSAEIWLYIYEHKLPINGAYIKGNSRAGCLFCPMSGGKSDYVQYHSYPTETDKYIGFVKELNGRYQDDPKALETYISNGGWNARKNGRDLNIENKKYIEKVTSNKLIISITDPNSNWKEWIKPLGVLPFDFDIKEKQNGYDVYVDSNLQKKYPTEIKRFKQLFHKSAYCVGCKVCETNCRQGAISFVNGINIDKCIHCQQCYEIDDGCLLYHSLRTSNGGNTRMKNGSINSFASHAPKNDWIRDFFEQGNDFWELPTLGPNQINMFKSFLSDSGLIDEKGGTTYLYDISKIIGWENSSLWGVILANLAYNPQINWYIENFDIGMYYSRENAVELLMSFDVSKTDSGAIVGAYKRFCETPLGYSLNFGSVIDNGRQIESLCRTKCIINDARVVLYSLFRFAEECNNYREFTLSWLFNEDVDRNGVSPNKIYGLDREEIKSFLLGLTSKYPDFINATFTNDLEKISLSEKKSSDVLKLFEEV
jgi:phosphoadenosine phosphosulfate reductase